jgi:hypothetical protein
MLGAWVRPKEKSKSANRRSMMPLNATGGGAHIALPSFHTGQILDRMANARLASAR